MSHPAFLPLPQQKAKGAPLAELRQVLPSLPESAVQSLIQELREEGKVCLEGLRRWARWKLVEYGTAKA